MVRFLFELPDLTIRKLRVFPQAQKKQRIPPWITTEPCEGVLQQFPHLLEKELGQSDLAHEGLSEKMLRVLILSHTGILSPADLDNMAFITIF